MTQITPVSAADQRLLQLVYDLMNQRGAWPTFTAVDLRADRMLNIEDAQAALLALPRVYISRPWHASGFSDSDEVRLTLRGVMVCAGGRDDLDLLARFVAWVVRVEREVPEVDENALIVRSADFVLELGLSIGDASADHDGEPHDATENDVEPEEPRPGSNQSPEVETARARLSRLRVLVDLLPHFWSGVHWQPNEPWLWDLTIDRRRVRPYRHVEGPDVLLEHYESAERDRRSAQGSINSFSEAISILHELSEDVGPTAREAEAVVSGRSGEDLDILLPILRAEIAEVSAELVRANRFDDAIFAAFRRVEHEVQQRIKNPSIGNDLIKLAFREAANSIRVTEREADRDRLVELFGGAIGLFKGDRSHKDRPLLPCRSRYECLRLLAHASTLLDLLDRDIDRAPVVRGHEHRQGGSLTLWVDRATSQVEAWLDETIRLGKISYRPGSLVVDVDRVPPGEHRIHLVDGHRQGAAHTVWFVSEPNLESWYRVIEINIPLFGDSDGREPLDATGVRLLCLEAGAETERIMPTEEAYAVGHYVSWQASTTKALNAVWVRDRESSSLRKLWDGAMLFEGQPVAPAHPARLMHISLEPSYLRLRRGAKAPLRVLKHLTDGVATWTEALDDPQVEAEDEKIVYFRGGAVIAKAPGNTRLRCLLDGCSAEAAVEVASHPRGTRTELLTGLPPVAGIAWTADGLVVSTRSTELWRVEKNGVYRLVAATPRMHTVMLGTDKLAANSAGDIAVVLPGLEGVLVLHRSTDYATSQIVAAEWAGTLMALAWDEGDLIVGTHLGFIYRVGINGPTTKIAEIDGTLKAITRSSDGLLVLCSPAINSALMFNFDSLWHIDRDNNTGGNILSDRTLSGLAGMICVREDVYLSDFHGGRVIRLPRDGLVDPTTVVEGLRNPSQLTLGDDGTLYIADFSGGAVHQILP
ncbi:TIGR02391 family protein [Amycolatopsis sp. NPDC051716]|uniref:TIGR02391 family protein n=1 Tax=Amycolatopsis sp. NPDC051716 TaxID=3155804 RepID=UPI00341D5424